MIVFALLACTPDRILLEAAFSDDQEAIVTTESTWDYRGGGLMGGSLAMEAHRPARVELDGERLRVDLPDDVTLGFDEGFSETFQPRWMRSRGYVVLGLTAHFEAAGEDRWPIAGVVDDATGDLLWVGGFDLLPTPSGDALVWATQDYVSNELVVVWYDPADGTELATHRVSAEGRCLTGFDADERLVVTCMGDTVTSFAVAQDGTVDRTAELDDCGYRQRTTSSPWAWDGGSVWDVVGREGRGDATMVRLDDEPGVACSW